MPSQSASESSDEGGDPPRSGICPSCKRFEKFTVHHIVPKWVLKYLRMVLVSPPEGLSQEQQQDLDDLRRLFHGFRPPLIDLCRGCHNKVEKIIISCPKIADERDYYRAVKAVVGPGFHSLVYYGNPCRIVNYDCAVSKRQVKLIATGKLSRDARVRPLTHSFQPLVATLIDLHRSAEMLAV